MLIWCDRALAKTPGSGPPSTGRKAQPIASLNPYMSGWTIKARMATKDSLRSFNRGSETISVFTCELVDEQVTSLQPVGSWLPACMRHHLLSAHRTNDSDGL